jgi:hypothetical protein
MMDLRHMKLNLMMDVMPLLHHDKVSIRQDVGPCKKKAEPSSKCLNND